MDDEPVGGDNRSSHRQQFELLGFKFLFDGDFRNEGKADAAFYRLFDHGDAWVLQGAVSFNPGILQ